MATPFGWSNFLQKEQFHLAAGGGLVAENTGGNHLGIVEHQHVGRTEVIDDIVDGSMLDLSGFPVQHHHARQLSPFGRVLGDQLRRQIIVEQVGFHLIASKAAARCAPAENKTENVP